MGKRTINQPSQELRPSLRGRRLTAALECAFTPADQLLKLPLLGPDFVPNSMVAYIMSKRANHLRVQASSIGWGKRGARVNSISPGIVLTPLALHELNSPIGEMYKAMIAASPAKRMSSPDIKFSTSRQ